MELVTFGKEVVQTGAEHAASYKLGQTVLRHVDRALWVVEKAARWAVPPPLDQDDKPQPELVRPLPWVFFLMLLMVLRVTRESVSLVHLVMGKPPLRSADMVMYIQGKRRYLRTLKYQGARLMRARGSTPRQPWFSGARSLLQFTMCFRRHSANNNSLRAHDNEQIMVVKRNKRGRQTTSPVTSSNENTMERLLEKMMVDFNADSDDDSSYTLTNATSIKSDSDVSSDQDTVFGNDVSISTPNKHAISTPQKQTEEKPQESDAVEPKTNFLDENIPSSPNNSDDTTKSDVANSTQPKPNALSSKALSENVLGTNKGNLANPNATYELKTDDIKQLTTKEETQNFLRGEKNTAKNPTSPKKKIANGRVTQSSSSKKGILTERRESSLPTMKVNPNENNGSTGQGKDYLRH